MKAVQLFEKKPVLSFEVFPPKPNVPIESIYETLAALKNLKPDFISVTYGAGGSVPGASTAKSAKRSKIRTASRRSRICPASMRQRNPSWKS